jgi:hypothetical protein
MDSHKHANTSTYERASERDFPISTLIQAYMSVLMRWILISTLIQAYIYERAYERDSHKHANTSIYERAYERVSHKHANTSIYERAYEMDSHKHANTSIYMSVLMRGILIRDGPGIRYLRGGLGNFAVHEFFFYPQLLARIFFSATFPLHDIFFKMT